MLDPNKRLAMPSLGERPIDRNMLSGTAKGDGEIKESALGGRASDPIDPMPPMASTRRLQIANPRPGPFGITLTLGPKLREGLKEVLDLSGAIPIPLSRTERLRGSSANS